MYFYVVVLHKNLLPFRRCCFRRRRHRLSSLKGFSRTFRKSDLLRLHILSLLPYLIQSRARTTQRQTHGLDNLVIIIPFFRPRAKKVGHFRIWNDGRELLSLLSITPTGIEIIFILRQDVFLAITLCSLRHIKLVDQLSPTSSFDMETAGISHLFLGLLLEEVII